MRDDHTLALRSDLGQVLLLAYQTQRLCIFKEYIVASRPVGLHKGNSTALLGSKCNRVSLTFRV
jgi:hypothetical protein